MSTAILNRNLKALEARNPGLAERIRATTSAAAVLDPLSRCEFDETADGLVTAAYRGSRLASKHRPVEEAQRFADRVDLIENAVVVVLGFGLGYHVAELGRRLSMMGILIVFEPDLALLRAALERIDHSEWIEGTQFVIFHDAEDRADLSRRLEGAGAIVAQGTTIAEHPASRQRLGDLSGKFSKTLAEVVAALRTTLATTLVHSVTTCRNLALNLDHYGAGNSIAPLHDWAKGRTAILVAAGPSLARNVHLLQDPSVRERAVIFAVQTALKPLLAKGIRPHFVTALDYHEISRQFYEGLTAEDVEGIALICEPKANRAIVDAFPGLIRCVGNEFLDRVLGPVARDMPQVTAGATVAHLNFYLAQYMGCDPIALVGQDLGFSEGLYYGPGAAIHEQWAPEINPFNTIEMMEWYRVTRMKRTLRDAKDQAGRSMLMDEQMTTYLQQFERDFARAPQQVIDATEGGTVKMHTQVHTLAQVLDDLGREPLPPMPEATDSFDPERIEVIRGRLNELRERIQRLGDLSTAASTLLDKILEDQHDQKRVDRHFRKMDEYRAEVDSLADIMVMVNSLNQLGVFNRVKADRRLEMSADLDEQTKQRRQLERDQINVDWLADASTELDRILDEADQVLRGERIDARISQRAAELSLEQAGSELASDDVQATDGQSRVAAMIAVDPRRGGMLINRRLDESLFGRSVLQCTLERLGRCRRIESIVLLVADESEVEALIDRDSIDLPIVMQPIAPDALSDVSIYDSTHEVIAAARRWSDTCWRGGIGGMTAYDEIICPRIMHDATEDLALDAVLLVGADWPLVDPSDETGCDAVVRRYLEQPDQHEIVFTQAPPGLVGCIVTRNILKEMAERNRQATVGALLSYVPQLPQNDPIGMEMCVKVPATVRTRHLRATFDTAEQMQVIRSATASWDDDWINADAEQIVHAVEVAVRQQQPELPRQLELELCAQRVVNGPVTRHKCNDTSQAILDVDVATRLLDQLSQRDDAALTLGGTGEPLLHPDFAAIVERACDLGITAIHVQTDLLCEPDAVYELLQLPIDVVSVRLNADRAVTYEAAMGSDRFQEAVENLERLINARTSITGQIGRLTRPWIVPTIVRCDQTYEDIRSFVDRWIYFVGAVVVNPLPAADQPDDLGRDSLIKLAPPQGVTARDARRRMTVRADGQVPLELDTWSSQTVAGNASSVSLNDLWKQVLAYRMHQTDSEDQSTPVVQSSPTGLETGLLA